MTPSSQPLPPEYCQLCNQFSRQPKPKHGFMNTWMMDKKFFVPEKECLNSSSQYIHRQDRCYLFTITGIFENIDKKSNNKWINSVWFITLFIKCFVLAVRHVLFNTANIRFIFLGLENTSL